ncbi:hypothetical protein APHAL10511_002229 [Amanita phalloides]|nr:hypothetical protein APHAL10511_002229 [Amanita phalloides]
MDLAPPAIQVIGAIRLPPGSEVVTDADEEVFIIYSLLQSKPAASDKDSKFRGLGHVDSLTDVLDINFEIKLPSNNCPEGGRPGSKRARSRKRHVEINEKVIHVTLAQDKTALRTRKGDTGSVLWKASIDFAQLVLEQIHSIPNDSLLDPKKLQEQHILELGSGTGLLSVVFAPLVGHYTATDLSELVPLMRKNISLNFPGWSVNNVSAEELDWISLSTASVALRKRIANFRPVDILLVVDCIYHPSLLPHLVETIDYLSIPGRTVVLVLVELRAEDVIREFLTIWLNQPMWRIWRIGNDTFPMPYVAWAGCKSSS